MNKNQTLNLNPFAKKEKVIKPNNIKFNSMR